MITFADMMTHLATQIGAPVVGTSEAKVRTSVVNAWSALMTETWRYFHRQGHVQLKKSISAGTAAFVESTRLVTFTGAAVLPADTDELHLLLDGVWYPVLRRISDTQLELSADECPPADVAATTYHLQRRMYPLPAIVGDVVQIVDPKRISGMFSLDLLSVHAYGETTGVAAFPTSYAILAVNRYPGRRCLWVPALITEDRVLAYLYCARRPELILVKETTGTVTAAGGVLTFSDSVVDSRWEQAVIRISKNDQVPTGLLGDDGTADITFNQFCHEVKVQAVLTTSTVRIYESSIAITAAPYVASTHIDVGGGAMEEALQRLCEDQYGVRPVQNHTEGLTSRRRVAEALQRAHAEDANSFGNGASQASSWYRLRLSDVASGVSG